MSIPKVYYIELFISYLLHFSYYYTKSIIYRTFICINPKNEVILHQKFDIMNLIEIGIVLKNRRNELDITQTDLAELANVTKGTVIRYEKGEGNPSFSVLNKLLNVLGLELNVDVIKTK